MYPSSYDVQHQTPAESVLIVPDARSLPNPIFSACHGKGNVSQNNVKGFKKVAETYNRNPSLCLFLLSLPSFSFPRLNGYLTSKFSRPRFHLFTSTSGAAFSHHIAPPNNPLISDAILSFIFLITTSYSLSVFSQPLTSTNCSSEISGISFKLSTRGTFVICVIAGLSWTLVGNGGI